MVCHIPPLLEGLPDQLFKHAQLETVQAAIVDPAYSGLALHARVQRAIRQLIVDGALGVGKQLPASRSLAYSLRVSRDTIEAAYAQLHAEGFIVRHTGSGSFVSEKTDFSLGRSLKSAGRNQFSAPPPKAKLSCRGLAIYKGGGVSVQLTPRAFAPGIPETRGFPIALWERLQRQVLKEHGERALQHSDPQGVESLRQAIADYINLERGARAHANCVVILTSSQQALTLCATVLLDAGDKIFIEDPAYIGARKAFDAANLLCVPVPVDSEGMQVSYLRKQAPRGSAVFLTPSHQFPTGSTLGLSRRLALIEWANKNQAWIIEDDYDSEFHYSGAPTACVQGLDVHRRTIYIGTFTKSLFPGLRLGYLVVPPQLVKPMTIARTLLDGHSASISQFTLARFIEGGHFGAHIRTMRKIYAERLDILNTGVERHLSGIVEPHVPRGGLQMPCLMSGSLTEQISVDVGKSVGVDLLGLSSLYASQCEAPGWLMGFAAYAPHEINAGVKKLADALTRLHLR